MKIRINAHKNELIIDYQLFNKKSHRNVIC
jgi:hypothetical protein